MVGTHLRNIPLRENVCTACVAGQLEHSVLQAATEVEPEAAGRFGFKLEPKTSCEQSAFYCSEPYFERYTIIMIVEKTFLL